MSRLETIESKPAPPITDAFQEPLGTLPSSFEARLAETEERIAEIDPANDAGNEEIDSVDSIDQVWIWGLPFAKVTSLETVNLVDQLIEQGCPSLFITANLHYAMLTEQHPELSSVNDQSTFIVADGMPMVWYSRWRGNPLPERVTGADLIFSLCERAAERGHRVFLLGGAPGIADQAAQELVRRYPGLQIAGTEAPMMNELSPAQHEQLIARIRATKPDLLFAALGQPKGEIWLGENRDALDVPVCAQIGATLDFVAGRVKRAPKWIQRIGMEWLYRTTREPVRMIPRYSANARFLFRALLRDLRAKL